MWYLATEVVSAGALSGQSSEHNPGALVCVCARFFGVFFWYWVCMDVDSARSGVQPRAPDNGIENDGYPQIIVETTLALIKPDAIDRSEDVVDIILRSGFSVLRASLLFFSVYKHCVYGAIFTTVRTLQRSN